MAQTASPIPIVAAIAPQQQQPPSPPTLANGDMTTTTTTTPKPTPSIQISIPDPSITTNTPLMHTLLTLINTVYTAAESGIFSPVYQRTTLAELTTLLHARELALAWDHSEPGSSSSPSLAGTIRVFTLTSQLADIGMLCCAPSLAGTGVGRALVEFAEGYARRVLGAETMQLELLFPVEFVHPLKVRLQGWYERMGYAVVRVGDFGDEYPHLKPHLVTRIDYRVFEKRLV
ncbi:hypothetical protein B0T22DRAFT_169463 [Podospora appendiculata]|uniref:N-acetyltransferase domain-containing protein n=1 Tax=Podospora appendiculata TaxID=314037 RepID=A0AAE0XAU8_9PEZI|nr:hypothetical protein B0T22DRAFT_169463 [Podospora appendiculata]